MPTAKRTPLAKLARGGNAVVIALDAIKDQARQRWSLIGPAANAAVEGLLRQKLGPADHFVQIDELNWLVVMPEASIEEVQACCVRIAYELQIKVRPPCAIRHLRVASATMAADDVLELEFLTEAQLYEGAQIAGLDQELLISKPPGEAAEVPGSGDPAGPACFLPIWDAPRQAISGYLCQPEIAGSGSHLAVGELLKCALSTLAVTASAIEKARAERAPCIIFAPLHYDMLSAPPTRMDFLSACRQMTCALRPHIVFEIAHLPAGVPKSRLIEIVSAIQPFARAVIGRAEPNCSSLMDYGGTGLKALGVDVHSSYAAQAPQEIARVCSAAKRLGIAANIGGVAAPKLLDHAIAAGAQWISGPAVGAPVSQPAPPARLTIQALRGGEAGAS